MLRGIRTNVQFEAISTVLVEFFIELAFALANIPISENSPAWLGVVRIPISSPQRLTVMAVQC
jgi:hypothetical protein